MPTPRQQAQKINKEKADYCGACGLPKKDCACGSYVERGTPKEKASDKKEER